MQIHFIVNKNNVVESDYTDTFVSGKSFKDTVMGAFPNFTCFADGNDEMFLDAYMDKDYYIVHAELVRKD